MGDHFLIALEVSVKLATDELWSHPAAKMDLRKFIPFCALNHIIQNEDGAVVTALEDEDILIF